jgi:hypothetical protein
MMKRSPRTAYLEYMIRIHQLFVTRITEEDSNKVMDVLGINKDKINSCVKETFDEKGDNKVLREMA